ncbi:hypothetical protein PoB_006584300 [Plakobranchus ocellatus]|uniref:Uncharacterized protein n=1 Tax=Plakobranchus ocellatus TaxID=259542 RepID=A0AAV4D5K5_9GAST|nr:hypothetical protein PoB_006584300 [Plakobranchus ocellatus]
MKRYKLIEDGYRRKSQTCRDVYSEDQDVSKPMGCVVEDQADLQRPEGFVTYEEILLGLQRLILSACDGLRELLYQEQGVGGTLARSADILLSRGRAPPLAPRLDEVPESLRSPRCGPAIYKNQTLPV